jgi:glyoxylase-like metal-dependent hydrolase (beta-lactamase superfamily II)
LQNPAIDRQAMELPPVRQYVSDTGVRIYRIPFSFLPGITGRVYLVLEAGPPTLVDAGVGGPDALGEIVAGLATVGREFGEWVGLRDIRRFLVTHAHPDHVGGLWQLARETAAEVVVHPLDARRVAAVEERLLLAEKSLSAFLARSGVPADEQAEVLQSDRRAWRNARSVPVDRTVEDGQELDGLQFIHTPGHSPGHLCIRAGNLLLCGDHVLSRTIPQQWPESIAACLGLGHYLDSLGKLRRLTGIELALGGHEPPVRNLRQRIDQIEDTHFRRLQRLGEILAQSPRPLSIHEITHRMYAVQKGFHNMLALMDVGARVEYLDQRGRLAIANLDELAAQPQPPYRYRPA